MKLKFKKQAFQTRAVESVADCFTGQPMAGKVNYRIDPGVRKKDRQGYYQTKTDDERTGFRNAAIQLDRADLLRNVQEVQRRQNLPVAGKLVGTKISGLNLDVEMETGTGKTYCYIKTAFELNRRFGWAKFIVVVPSIAIREGVYKSLEITADHFQETYGKRARFFIYNSKQLHHLESFSSDAGINIMVINVQAFNSRAKDNRRIYEELDDFQSRRPIDVIKKNHPILILDEPQKMEGKKTLDSLKEFNPLFILRYSATHKTQHNKVHRLDALDAYTQKLVKKISVRGISVRGLAGTNAYLYLESIQISKQSPAARIELEIRRNNGIKRIIRRVSRGDNLYDLSRGLDQYKGFVVSDIDAVADTVEFTNGIKLTAGEAVGDVNERDLRRIQIREAIRSHFEKEQVLFPRGIKVLTLFFIDEVAKYRVYGEAGEQGGEYARMFEQAYRDVVGEMSGDLFMDKAYKKYLDNINVDQTHNGYFSIDKKGKLVDPKETGRGENRQCNDADAYDLILRDKERLLSMEEPTRFIFSHSALREGWDNPNVFVICTLKHSDNTISRRQEVGRGLRLSVNQQGIRQDDPATVHQTNVLTVVANESYRNFVSSLQSEISESLSERPRIADAEYFSGKILVMPEGNVTVTPQMAKQIYRYLVKNDYTDDDDRISGEYHTAVKDNTLSALPDALIPHKDQVFQLIDTLYSDAKLPGYDNDRGIKSNQLNHNFEKREFKELWSRINKKAVYSVAFETRELTEKCVNTLNNDLRVSPLQYTVKKGDQTEDLSYDQLKSGQGFEVRETRTEYGKGSVFSSVSYDLIGKISEQVRLTRKTVAGILSGIEKPVFGLFKENPEQFISESARLINEQKASVIIEHLTYDLISETYDRDIFTKEQAGQNFSKAGQPLSRHIYDYAITDSNIERSFVEELDTSAEVVVYAKLPRGFFIPTPVGNYNPDWAIAFKEGTVKHIYFIAETKGSMSSLQLKEVEKRKIQCAGKFFSEINKKLDSGNVKYDVVDTYGKLMEIVG